jgi:hypothetical protein
LHHERVGACLKPAPTMCGGYLQAQVLSFGGAGVVDVTSSDSPFGGWGLAVGIPRNNLAIWRQPPPAPSKGGELHHERVGAGLKPAPTMCGGYVQVQFPSFGGAGVVDVISRDSPFGGSGLLIYLYKFFAITTFAHKNH